MRVGWGYDVHAFGGVPPIVLAGVVVDQDRGLVATSDGDVVAHAVADALLGSVALGDLGEFFPSADPASGGADSMELLGRVVTELARAGFRPSQLDVTVVSQSIRIAPRRQEMRAALAGAVNVDESAISVKGTTTDGLGAIGRDEGIAAVAVVVVEEAAGGSS